MNLTGQQRRAATLSWSPLRNAAGFAAIVVLAMILGFLAGGQGGRIGSTAQSEDPEVGLWVSKPAYVEFRAGERGGVSSSAARWVADPALVEFRRDERGK